MDNNVTNESINQSMNIFMTERGPTVYRLSRSCS